MNINDYSTKDVEVTSLYFKQGTSSRELESYPRTMILEGQEYNFVGDSLRFLIRRGQHLIKLFDVSDGQNTYRLKQDETNNWTLVQD